MYKIDPGLNHPFLFLVTPAGQSNGLSTNLFELARSMDWTNLKSDLDSSNFLSAKRKLSGRKDSIGSDDDDSVASAPMNDIYRQRQQKKIR